MLWLICWLKTLLYLLILVIGWVMIFSDILCLKPPTFRPQRRCSIKKKSLSNINPLSFKIMSFMLFHSFQMIHCHTWLMTFFLTPLLPKLRNSTKCSLRNSIFTQNSLSASYPLSKYVHVMPSKQLLKLLKEWLFTTLSVMKMALLPPWTPNSRCCCTHPLFWKIHSPILSILTSPKYLRLIWTCKHKPKDPKKSRISSRLKISFI